MHNKTNNRSFGILFFIVFLIIGLWPLLSGEILRLWSVILSLIFLLLGFINSKLLTPLHKAWIQLGITLGKVIAPLVMLVIFFAIVTPMGLLLKIFGKDLLKIKKNKLAKTYWTLRENIKSMDRQF